MEVNLCLYFSVINDSISDMDNVFVFYFMVPLGLEKGNLVSGRRRDDNDG